MDTVESRPANMPTLVLDFDGVLHSYTSGWKGAEIIPDEPVSGAIEFCKQALWHFDLCIVSTRCSQPGGTKAIYDWLNKYNFPSGILVSEDGKKPPAMLTLDDRAITFTGEWPDMDSLINFRPWNKK